MEGVTYELGPEKMAGVLGRWMKLDKGSGDHQRVF